MVHGQIHPVMVKERAYVVLNGRELLGIWDTQDAALACAHFHEQAELLIHNRLTICDIIPIWRNKLCKRA